MAKGRATRSFTVGGSYPAADAAGNPVPFNVAIQQLAVNGSVGLDWFFMDGSASARRPGPGRPPPRRGSSCRSRSRSA